MLEANVPVDGITCIAPMALAGETTRCFQPDSCQLTARASCGSTPYRFEVVTISDRICVRVGSLRFFRMARLRLACATMWSAYVRPANVLSVRAFFDGFLGCSLTGTCSGLPA